MYCKTLYLFIFYCAFIGFFLNCLIYDNYFLDLWINQVMKPSNYWCFNWFMTPKSLLIRLNDLIIRWLYNNHWGVCCLEFTFLEQSAQWSVPIVRMIMNENKLHILLLSMNQRSNNLLVFVMEFIKIPCTEIG